MFRALMFLLGWTFMPGALAAQVPTRSPGGAWVSGSLGAATPHGTGLYGTAAIRYRRVVVRARYATAFEFLGDFKEDWGGLVGLVLTRPSYRGLVVAAAGVGQVRGSRGCLLCGSAPDEPVLGALADLEFRYPFTKELGFSTYIYADFNSDRSFGGLPVGLYLGSI
ncbi:MAG: hypothetical protein WD934_09930 [Gemmatimonadales bacterium]